MWHALKKINKITTVFCYDLCICNFVVYVLLWWYYMLVARLHNLLARLEHTRGVKSNLNKLRALLVVCHNENTHQIQNGCYLPDIIYGPGAARGRLSGTTNLPNTRPGLMWGENKAKTRKRKARTILPGKVRSTYLLWSYRWELCCYLSFCHMRWVCERGRGNDGCISGRT